MARLRGLPRSLRVGLIALALLVGFATYVWAQGVGIFSRSACSALTSPVAGKTFCFDGTNNGLSVYTGSWLPLIGTAPTNNVIVDATSVQITAASVQITNSSLSLINNRFYSGATTGGSVQPLIGLSTAGVVNVDPNGNGALFGASATLANAFYYTGKTTGGSTQPLIGMNASNAVAVDPNGNGVTTGGTLTSAGGVALPSGVTGGNKGVGTVNGSGSPAYYQGGTAITTITMKSGSGAGDYTTSSTTYVDIDGTNLAFTVTIPTGFKMLINAHALAKGSSLGAAAQMALTDGTTLLTEVAMNAPVVGDLETLALTYVYTGDGASHTFKLRYLTSAGTLTVTNSSSTNPPRMTFLMAPSS